MSIIVDVVLLAIIIFIVVRSANKGFVASFLDTFATLISGVVSFLFCGKVADSIYNLCIEDLVKTEYLQTLDDMSSGATTADKISAMVDSLPAAALKLANYFGTNVDSLKRSVTGGYGASDEELIELVADQITYDIMIGITKIVTFIVLFVGLALVIRLLSQFFSHTLEKVPLVGGLDTVLGGAFGLVKGGIIIAAVVVFLSFIVATAEAGSPLTVIDDSFVYKLLSGINPLK